MRPCSTARCAPGLALVSTPSASCTRAVEEEQFELHYQPLFDVSTGDLVRVEALARWHHPVRGLVPPAEFIAVAEETRLIVPFGEWVIQEATRQAARWKQARGGQNMPVAVNVASHQLASAELPAVIDDALAASGCLARDLAVEITESAVLADIDAACRTLAALREIGVRVSVDDFGTGYSSLSYIQRLPIDELKIDRSFVAPLGASSTTGAIVGSIVDLAHAVGLGVVAEGVETAPQLEAVGRLGCDLAQGFYLGRPVAAGELAIADRHPLLAP